MWSVCVYFLCTFCPACCPCTVKGPPAAVLCVSTYSSGYKLLMLFLSAPKSQRHHPSHRENMLCLIFSVSMTSSVCNSTYFSLKLDDLEESRWRHQCKYTVLYWTHPLQLDAEGLIPVQPADGCPARPTDHSGVQSEHRADLH